MDSVITSWPLLIATGLVIALSQCVYMTFGFGAGMLAIAVLNLFAPSVQYAVIILMLVSMPVELLVIGKSLRHFDWRSTAAIALGIIVAVPLGAWLLKSTSSSWQFYLLGTVIIATGSYFMRKNTTRRAYRFPKWLDPIIGMISGFLSGAFGTGGPPLVAYFQLQQYDKSQFRMTLLAIFFATTLVRLPSYALSGMITVNMLVSAALIFPVGLLGAYIGTRLHLQVEERLFKRLVGGALVVLGALTILKQIVQ